MRPRRIEPGPGQESVWDYPRPPVVDAPGHHVVVVVGGLTVADSYRPLRVLETSSPPVYYLPPDDVRLECLTPAAGRSTLCEWKGRASYLDVSAEGRTVVRGAWTYRKPRRRFAAIQDHLAFYPSRMDACYVDGERVTPQPGDFYGGWVTSRIVGPFKGGPGTLWW